MSETSEQDYYCSLHNQPAKWQCGICGRPVCQACEPRGFNYQVYHPACIAKARDNLDYQQQARAEVEAPSLGVKLFAWIMMVGGMLLFGLALFFLIFSLVGQQVPIRALMTGTVAPSLDSIPGARSGLMWLGTIGLVLSVLIGILGIGLLNCVAAARRVLLVMAWIDILAASLAWVVIGLIGQGWWTIPIVSGLAVWFFSKRKVKQQFEQVL